MPTERIVIEVVDKGVREVKRSMDAVDPAARRAGGSVGFFQRALLAAASVQTLRTLIQMSDTFAQITNNLRTVTTSSENLAEVQEQLFQLSLETSTVVSDNVRAYQQLALAADDLGLSQQDNLRLLRSVNQAIQLSGATGTEARTGLEQFTRALADGAIRGIELQSILKQFPVIADVIANKLGVTRGELRKLGEEGKIDGQLIVEAFAEAGEELDQKFAARLPEVGEAFTNVGTAVLDLVGAFNQALEAGNNLATVVNNLAIAITQLADNVRRSGIGGLGEAFFSEFQRLGAAEEEAARINRLLLEQQRRREAGVPEQEAVRGFDVPPPVAPKESAAARDALKKQEDAVARINQELARERELLGLTNREREIRQQLFAVEDQLVKAGIDLKEEEGQAALAGIEVQLRELDAIREVDAVMQEIQGPEEERIRRQQVLNQLLQDGRISQDQFTEAVRRLNEELGQTSTFAEALSAQFLAIDTSAASLGATIGGVLVGAVDQLSGAVADFAVSGFRDFEQFKENLSDILRSIAREIIKLIVQFLILKAVQAGLNALGGGAAGPTIAGPGQSGPSGIPIATIGLQAGGFAAAGEPVLVGERRPEIFVPTRSGNVRPDAGGAMAPEVTVNVVNVTNPDEVHAALGTAEGERTILNVLQRNRRQAARILTGA